MARGISLANKCLLLFGLAVVLIVLASLIYPWIQLRSVIDDAQRETSRQIARLHGARALLSPAVARALQGPEAATADDGEQIALRYYPIDEWTSATFAPGSFEAVARETLAAAPRRTEFFEPIWGSPLWEDGGVSYDYAGLVVGDDGAARGVVHVHRASTAAANQLFVHRMLLVASGFFAAAFAIAVFYLITTRLVLGPVRELRGTAARVREGNLAIRSEIHTGDEFEQLSEAFNAMLDEIGNQQGQLRAMNRSLDLRLSELTERNSALFETARLKGEFLANVSHELRTPLNSIIGFAEILQEIAAAEQQIGPAAPSEAQLAKRSRYIDNIVNAGRSLLEMINELLTMAKIEAGKIELHVQPVNVAETSEALLALIRPLADRKSVTLRLQLGSAQLPAYGGKPGADLPLLRTDAQKLNQIVFNFLSNAVKFTPEGGSVTLRVERMTLPRGDIRVRFSVIDTGPGIPQEHQRVIFEKFRQLEGGHTRAATGTGLGLAIAKEFAEMIGGEIQLVSEEGRGSKFSLIVPVEIAPPASPAGGDATPNGAAAGRPTASSPAGDAHGAATASS